MSSSNNGLSSHRAVAVAAFMSVQGLWGSVDREAPEPPRGELTRTDSTTDSIDARLGTRRLECPWLAEDMDLDCEGVEVAFRRCLEADDPAGALQLAESRLEDVEASSQEPMLLCKAYADVAQAYGLLGEQNLALDNWILALGALPAANTQAEPSASIARAEVLLGMAQAQANLLDLASAAISLNSAWEIYTEMADRMSKPERATFLRDSCSAALVICELAPDRASAEPGMEVLQRGSLTASASCGPNSQLARHCRVELASGYCAVGDCESGILALREARQTCDSSSADERLEALMIDARIAIALIPLKRFDEAFDVARRALEALDSRDRSYRALRLNLLDICGDTALAREQVSEADGYFKELLVLIPPHRDCLVHKLSVLKKLVVCAEVSGDVVGEIQYAKLALETGVQLYGEASTQALLLRRELIGRLSAHQHYSIALDEFAKCKPLVERAFGKAHTEYVGLLKEEADLHLNLGQPVKAKTILREALTLARQLPTGKEEELIEIFEALADAEMSFKPARGQKALEQQGEAISVARSIARHSPMLLVAALYSRASLLDELGLSDQALEDVQAGQAVLMPLMSSPQKIFEQARMFRLKGQILQDQHEYEDALACFDRALVGFRRLDPPATEFLVGSEEDRAICRLEQSELLGIAESAQIEALIAESARVLQLSQSSEFESETTFRLVRLLNERLREQGLADAPAYSEYARLETELMRRLGIKAIESDEDEPEFPSAAFG